MHSPARARIETAYSCGRRSAGTLFLDEIGEIAPNLQAKLLHVLENRTVRPVGANKERRIDVRIVAATHRDLHDQRGEGSVSGRPPVSLDVVSIEIPPLRHRQPDIPVLLSHFLELAKAKHPESPVERLSKGALERLLDHRWPGNVRELEHLVEARGVAGQSE